MMEKNILGVIKDDMNELVHRLNFHQEGYLRVFSLERTRKHFDDIFFSRYKTVSGSDLALVSESLLQIISRFYHEVSDLYFYFKMTEDMPSAVSNKLSTSLKVINDIHTEFVDFVVKLDLNNEEESVSNLDTGSEVYGLEGRSAEDKSEGIDEEQEVSSEDSLDLSLLEENFSNTKGSGETSESEPTSEPDRGSDSISIDELEDDDPPPFVK